MVDDSAKPQLVWLRTFSGARPGVLLGREVTLIHTFDGRGEQASSHLVCADLSGNELWRRTEMRGWLALPEERLVVSDAHGRATIVDANGTIVRSTSIDGFQRVTRCGSLLVLASVGHAWVTDLELRPVREFAKPNQIGLQLAQLRREALYWIEGRDVQTCESDGIPHTIATLSQDLITDAIDRYERLRGRGQLALRLPGPWRVTFDERRGLFFCANALVHLVYCLDAAGTSRWCECLAPGCCGGVPQALPSGLYAASGGCNGIISWIDEEGTILLQSLPHQCRGLGSAYSGNLEVTSNGWILVQGGPGLLCYGGSGDHLWTIPRMFSSHVFDPSRGVLITCRWHRQSDDSPGISTLERYDFV